MIYPTPRAIAVAALGAPLALAAGLAAPGLWATGAAWVVTVGALVLVDVLLAASPRSVRLALTTPRSLGVGAEGEAEVEAAFDKSAPARLQLAVGVNDRITAAPARATVETVGGAGRLKLRLTTHRRGEAVFERLWARWRGPLGMAWIQREEALGQRMPVVPDIQQVKDEALRLFARDAPIGTRAQIETGEGAEFHALKEFSTGMDLRSIDWKQSARHGKLVAREYRTERNHSVVLALDCGRLMSAPLGGVPRIDRAINAALLLAFVCLKLGDRVGLFAFDARPRVASGQTAGAGAFPLLQRLAAGIDYSEEETNFTLGLTTLAGRLDRRALVVVFTDFADPTSAELMLENVARLLRTHLVLFVVFRDEALEAMVQQEPMEPADVSRAVIAAALARQREVVIGRLRRLGAHIVDAPAERMGAAVVNGYIETKRRELM